MHQKTHVLYEDNHVIAVEKPAGVLIDDLMEQVKLFLKEKYSKPGNVFLGMVHQIDRPVSGIVLFGKTTKGASRLSEQFRDRETGKIYHAWVEGDVKSSGTIRNYLKKDENRRKSFVYEEEVRDSQLAELDYEVVRREKITIEKENVAVNAAKSEKKADKITKKGNHPIDTISLVRVKLKTGRFHQIRAQFGRKGYPVVGDVKYGSKISFPDSHIALFATSMTFKTVAAGTPEGGRADGEQVTVTLPVPKAPVFNL
jgi:23S rRNA pseudouridine1911/1915/1917 synthase